MGPCERCGGLMPSARRRVDVLAVCFECRRLAQNAASRERWRESKLEMALSFRSAVREVVGG